jgi:hypothetical protein
MKSRRHVPYVGANHEPYVTTPPTSGPHVPWTVAPGLYDEEIAPELQVHALEHGHVLVQYGDDVPPEDVDRLEGLARRYLRAVIVAPNSELHNWIALTAWGRIERIHSADRDRIDAFVEALFGRYVHGWRGGATPCPVTGSPGESASS